jgi:hypothetical protein
VHLEQDRREEAAGDVVEMTIIYEPRATFVSKLNAGTLRRTIFISFGTTTVATYATLTVSPRATRTLGGKQLDKEQDTDQTQHSHTYCTDR